MKPNTLLIFSSCLLYLAASSAVNATSIEMKSCLDFVVQRKAPANGYYHISDDEDEPLTVYCDFSSEPGSAWTLVMSWALKYNNMPAFKSVPFFGNGTVNGESPNWNMYRLSKSHMNAIKSQDGITHWRATCCFPYYKVDYRDYVRGKFDDFDIMTYNEAETCKDVELISIRKYAAVNVQSKFWQGSNELLHTDSSTFFSRCSFDATEGSMHGEDNFGFYASRNTAFRCTSSSDSTTQYWFGGYY